MKKTFISLLLLGLSISILSMGPVAAQAAQRPSIEQVIGHNFEEESWAIEFDVLSNKLVKDWTPGEFAPNVTAPLNDPSPMRDANFYSVYLNMGQVRTSYMALTNYSWNVNDSRAQGVAPYQILLQAFRAPGNAFVIVENVFAGLVAYQENKTSANGVPTANDNLYYGFSLNSEFHKHMIKNQIESRVNQSVFPTDPIPVKVTPMNLTKTNNSATGETVFTFGISYENMLVVWVDMKDNNADLNQTARNQDVNAEANTFFQKLVAISTISSLNFTYVVKGIPSEKGYANVTTSTEYDIGPIMDLWIKGDSLVATNALGGKNYTVFPQNGTQPAITLSRYNTSESIYNRLAGKNDTLGFGLAMANYARIAIVQAQRQNETARLQDKNGTAIDGETADQNVTKMEYRLSDINRPAFLIDFESKPDYTLNNSEVMPAPVRLYPNVHVRNPTLVQLDQMAHRFISEHIGRAIQNRIKNTNANLEINVEQRGVFYAICFPKWNGLQINQDPTFVAFAEQIDVTTKSGGLLSKIDGFTISTVIVLGLGTAWFLIYRYRRVD